MSALLSASDAAYSRISGGASNDFVMLASGEAKKSGPIGLAVILVLCVACYFLFKSMSKHLRKVREEFPVDGAGAADAAPPVDGDKAETTATADSATATADSADASSTTDDPPPA